jgi:hypothetical protein
MCAPITERALDCVVAGRAELRDALTHTATGTVDIVTVDSQGNRTESAKLCRDLDHQDLPAQATGSPADPEPLADSEVAAPVAGADPCCCWSPGLVGAQPEGARW